MYRKVTWLFRALFDWKLRVITQTDNTDQFKVCLVISLHIHCHVQTLFGGFRSFKKVSTNGETGIRLKSGPLDCVSCHELVWIINAVPAWLLSLPIIRAILINHSHTCKVHDQELAECCWYPASLIVWYSQLHRLLA